MSEVGTLLGLSARLSKSAIGAARMAGLLDGLLGEAVERVHLVALVAAPQEGGPLRVADLAGSEERLRVGGGRLLGKREEIVELAVDVPADGERGSEIDESALCHLKECGQQPLFIRALLADSRVSPGRDRTSSPTSCR